MKHYLFSALLLVSAIVANAQHEVRYCGQTEARERLFSRFPHAEADARLASEYQEKWNEQNRGGSDVYIIPVVFHIIHNNGAENITDEQVLDGLTILNRDYRLLNEDQEDVVPEFTDIMADVEIEFRLAGLDPDGNCTSGINRVVSELTYDGDDDMKDLIYWPRDMYLNVWVCADAAGAAGYTNLPSDVNSWWAASGDGIVIRHDYLGSIGTSSVGHSRVLTHEVGHWLNLYHTWGSSNNPGNNNNCNMDDLVSDTPNTIGWSSCNLDGASCGNDIDNIQNYMEYSYCTRMFTNGQRTRMRNALTSSVAQRNQLWTDSNLADTGTNAPVLCAAVFQAERTSVCLGDTVKFFDHSYHGVTSWLWDLGDGTIISGTDPDVHQNPVHVYEASGNYEISLTVGNGNESVQTILEDYISVIVPGMNVTPFAEGFENTWPGDDWFLYNQNNDYTWELATNAAYSGTKSGKIRNFSNNIMDNIDELISATYDMSAMDTVWLSYKWAYANKLEETDDRLRISVSGNCGTEWYLKKVHKGLTDLPTSNATNQQFTPTSLDQWTGNVLTLSDEDWLTNMFRVKFEFIAKGGNNIYLDDINLYGVGENGVYVDHIEPVMSMLVYPNPSDNNMTLELITTGGNTQIELFDAIGQKCEVIFSGSVSPGAHRYVINYHSAGIYTVVIRDNEGRVQTRQIAFK